MSSLGVRRPRRARTFVVTAIAVAVGGAALGSLAAPAASAMSATALAAASAATAIDTSFGGGLVASNLTALDDEAFAIAVQADGGTIVAGHTNWDRYKYTGGDLLVARYTAAGVLDAAFGTDGAFVVAAPASSDRANAVVLQPDGRIVVAGELAGLPVVLRLTAGGVLDPEFQGGTVTFPEATESKARTVAVHTDGTIRIGGTGVRRDRWGGPPANTVLQARLNRDGTRDPSFAPAGFVVVDAPADSTFVAMAVLPDGMLLAGGSVGWPVFGGGPNEMAALARYLPSGEIDTTFGTGGMVVVNGDTDFVDRGTSIAALAVQPDGRIVATGGEYIFGGPASMPVPGASPPAPTGIQHLVLGNMAVFRFLPDGALDTAFAGTGKVFTRVPGQPGPGAQDSGNFTVTPTDAGSRGISVTLAPGGGILVGGSSGQPFSEPLVVRYTSSGLVDTTFGRAGFLSVDRGGLQGVVNALAVRTDGRLAVAGASFQGWNEPPNFHDLLVGRVIPGTDVGAVWTWGWNALGQLGDGTTTDRSAPVKVSGLSGVVAVSASPYHSLALKGDGTVWAWGWNILGQLGDGTTVNRLSPVKVPGLTGVVAIAAGGLHSLALRGDGTVWAWGFNAYGTLADGTLANRSTPTKSKLAGVTSISAGLFHSLAIREEGTGWAWGYNGMGQIGDGTFTNRTDPVALPPQEGNYAYSRVGAGWLHSLSSDPYGRGRLWGWDQLGQVTGQVGGPSVPVPAWKLQSVMDMSAGGYHSLVTLRDGTIMSIGWNALGQLGRPGPPAYLVTGLTGGPIVSAGGVHSLAITADRRLLAWGWNYFGQLGTGTTADAPVPIAVPLSNPVIVAGGGYHSLAIQG